MNFKYTLFRNILLKIYIIENSSPVSTTATSNREEWPSLLKRCNQNLKVPGSNTTRHSDGTNLAVGQLNSSKKNQEKQKRFIAGKTPVKKSDLIKTRRGIFRVGV